VLPQAGFELMNCIANTGENPHAALAQYLADDEQTKEGLIRSSELSLGAKFVYLFNHSETETFKLQ